MEGNKETLARPLLTQANYKLFLGILILAVVLGIASGYFFSSKGTSVASLKAGTPTTAGVSAPQQDSKTFKDFAEGVIKPKPQDTSGDNYAEGTHLLERTGATSVALTSSVVDLSQYEGKKVKVFGETQKALKQGWLMDVGKVEVE